MEDVKQMKKKKYGMIIMAVFIVALGVLVWRAQRHDQEPISATAFKLNTVVTIQIYDSEDESLLERALEVCDRYEKLFSRTLQTSEIYRLNEGKLPQKDGWYTLSPETAGLVEQGLKYSRLSKGAFDLTVEPVSSLWDFTSEQKKVPDEKSIQDALPLVDYQMVEVKDHRLRFQKEHMGLDLGAIAKGYIADEIKTVLVEAGVKSATINLGGNVLCIGSKPDGTPFKIGIQKPFADRSETVGIVDISDRSVVSSGVYERYFEQDGKRYHHILDPSTGYSYDNGLLSVTIISDQSVDGDGLSTACFALGLEKGMKLADSLPNVQAVFITEDGQIHYSEQFEEELYMEFTK